MQIQRLDHFTVRTSFLEATRDFYAAIAGLRVGPRPPFDFRGYWLYDGDTPCVHLVDASDARLGRYLGAREPAVAACGALDHIAFRCTGLPSLEARLRNAGIAWEPRIVPALGEHQVFVADPNGVVVEFVFALDEVAGAR